MSSIDVEIMKPSLFTMPEKIDTIAVLKRDLFQTDTINFKYFIRNKQKTDTIIRYRDLSNTCVDALADYLKNDGYFLKVINYRDSLNQNSLINYPEIHEKLGVDAIVFLDFFQLDDHIIKPADVWITGYIDRFGDIEKSNLLEYTNAKLIWTFSMRGDTSIYLYRHLDNLYYGNSDYPQFFGGNLNHKLQLENSSIYLGKTFGAKLLPSWLKVERTYYRSSNIDMKQAEKFLMNGDWLKAAEIYSRETKNKNKNIAAKSKYNMALICEMEGKLDPAIDWLVNSYSTYVHGDEVNNFNCRQYINLLVVRKKEIARLDKQFREQSNSFSKELKNTLK